MQEQYPDIIFYQQYAGCCYNPILGVFYRLNQEGKIDKPLFPDENNFIGYFCTFTKKSIRRKGINLAWEFLNKSKVPSGCVVYPKDLDWCNFKHHNPQIMHKSAYRKLKDCLHNAEYIKIIQHPTDTFVYYVRYRKDGRYRKELCHDISKALALKRKILHKSIKFISKFIISQ